MFVERWAFAGDNGIRPLGPSSRLWPPGLSATRAPSCTAMFSSIEAREEQGVPLKRREECR